LAKLDLMTLIARLRQLVRSSRVQARYGRATTIAFVDTNVILEGRPLADLPWVEVDVTGPIHVVFTPKVLSEVDSKKRDGRLGKIARGFNRQIGSLATGAKQELELLAGPPQVTLGLVTSARIPWERYDDLDPDDADSRVVAEVLHADEAPAEKRIFVSQDLKPLSIAARHGLRTVHVSDAWIRQSETSKAEREAAKLREELTSIRRSEPSPQIKVKVLAATPVEIYRVFPLSRQERDAMVRRVLAQNSRPQIEALPSFPSLTDYSLSPRWDEYESQKVPAFAAAFHEKLQLQFCQVPVEIDVSNEGTIRADNLIVRINVAGGWLNDKPIKVPLNGPPAPRERSPLANLAGLRPPVVAKKPGRHEMHFAVRPRRRSQIEAHCEDFRHGFSWTFRGVLWLDPSTPDDCVISATATAANLHGEYKNHLRIAKSVAEVTWSDLVDPASERVLKKSHVEDWLQEAVAAKQFDQIELDGLPDR